MWIDTQAQGRSHAFWGSLNYLYGGSSGFPLASHFALSESIFDLIPGPPLCVHSSFNHDRF